MKARLILVTLAIVIMTAILVGFAVGDVDRLRPRVQAELQQKLNRPVGIGHLQLKLLPLSFQLEGLTIAESSAFPTGVPFATADEVFVSASLFSLMRGTPEVRDLVLNKPHVELVRNAAGMWNYSSLGESSGTAQSQFTLAQLRMNDGQVGFTDAVAKQARTQYNHVDATLTDFAAGQKFGIQIGVHFPGDGKQTVAFKGHVGPHPSASAGAFTISGHLSLNQVSLSSLPLMASPLPPASDAVVSGEADVTALDDVVACKGNLKFENTMIRGVKLDDPIGANYDVTSHRNQSKLQIRSSSVKLGALSFNVTGEMAYATSPPNLNLQIGATAANIAELLNIAKAYGTPVTRGVTGTGTLNLDLHVEGPVNDASKLVYAGTGVIANAIISVPALSKPLTIVSANATFSRNLLGLDNLVAQVGAVNLRGSLTATRLVQPQLQFALTADRIDTAELQQLTAAPANAATPQEPGLWLAASGSGTLAVGVLKAEDIVLRNIAAKCMLDHGVIQLSPFSADAFSGKANGSITADVRPAVPQCSVQIKLAGADANALLSSVSSVKNVLYGRVSADSNLRFDLASSAALARTLNGALSFDLTNGELKNMNILAAISVVSRFLNPLAAQDASSATKLKNFSGTLNIANGVASTDHLTAALDAGSLTANGSLNLVSQEVNMRTLTKVDGFGTIPVVVTGTMSNPKIVPDLAAFVKSSAGGILGNLLQGLGSSGKKKP